MLLAAAVAGRSCRRKGVWRMPLAAAVVVEVSPPHGLDCRQRCKIIKDFCCALAYLRSQEPQLVHGTPKIPMPLLRTLRGGGLNVKL